MVESEADGGTIESLTEYSWRTSIVAAVDGDGETSCAAVGEKCSSSGMRSEFIDRSLIDVGECVGEHCISRLREVERLLERNTTVWNPS